MSKIYNHNDIRTLLLPYSINYSSLDVKNKNKMNETIEKNTKKYINNYKKHHKKKILKKQKKQTKILSTDDKIDLSWNFIHSYWRRRANLF